jgi:ABC-type transport system substrate-binding protein
MSNNFDPNQTKSTQSNTKVSKNLFVQSANNLKKRVDRLRFEVQKIAKIIYPINWVKLQEYDVIIETLKNTNNFIRSVLLVSFVGLLVSCLFWVQGFYLVLTIDAANSKGTVNEAIFGSNFEKLNPLLTSSNDTEKKIIDLIYQPLYRITYPDFVTSAQKPVIEPVLLESEPAWQETPNGKILNLSLKPDLKWSDGTALTTDDVVYTFDRLKESSGNTDFRDIFANYKLNATTPRDMQLIQINTTKAFNPQIKYLLNFYPVSHLYFEDKKTDELINNPKSIQNEVSSGWFTLPQKVKIDGKEVSNPVADISKGYNIAIMERNKYNTYKPPFVEKYILKVYTDLVDVGGTANNSVERASINQKVDLFVRPTNLENRVSGSEIKSKFGLLQTKLPTNNYYILYSNLQSNQWLINTLLRKYIMCGVSELSIDNELFQNLPQDEKFTPIQLGDSFAPNCSNAKQELLSQQKNNKALYAENNGNITVDGNGINLNILSLDELNPLVKSIQEKLRTIGIESNLTMVKDADQLDVKISEKSYNLVFLPTTIISSDPYPMYGAKSRNISTINKNNRIGKEETKYGEGVEKLLKDYSESDLQNLDTKKQLVDIFRNEFVSLNMYRSNLEVNYSNKLKLPTNNFGNIVTFGVNIYSTLPEWYTETRRKFFWE